MAKDRIPNSIFLTLTHLVCIDESYLFRRTLFKVFFSLFVHRMNQSEIVAENYGVRMGKAIK